MESFCVYQTFTITFRGKFNGPLFVVYKRYPNGKGCIDSMSYWAPNQTLYPTKLYVKENELTREEFNAIVVKAVKEWNNHWTMTSLLLPTQGIKNQLLPPKVRSEGMA